MELKKSPPKRGFYFSTPSYSNSSGEIDTVGLSGICTGGSGICTVGVFPPPPPPPPQADNANAIAIIKNARFIFPTYRICNSTAKETPFAFVAEFHSAAADHLLFSVFCE